MSAAAPSGRQPASDVALGPLNEAFKFFLANMPFNITTDQIKEHFSQFGPVNFVKLIYDKPSGKPRGYGFLYMQTAQGNAAVESYSQTNNKRIQLIGRSNVFLARHDEKRVLPQRNAPRGGGRGGGVHAVSQTSTSYAQQQPQANGYATAPVAYAAQPTTYAAPQQQPAVGQPPGQAVTYAPAVAAPAAYTPAPAQPVVAAPNTYAAPPVAYGPASGGYSNVPAAPAPQQYGNPPQQQPAATYAPVAATTGQYHPAAAAPAVGLPPAPQVAATSYSYPHQAGAQHHQPGPSSYAAPPQQPVAAQPVSYAPQPQQPYAQPTAAQPAYVSRQAPAQQHVQPTYAPQQPAPPPPQQQRIATTKVLVENLPTDVTPMSIVQCLERQYSVKVNRCTMEYDKDPRASWCYAHVDLATAADASRVIQQAKQGTLQYRGRILQASPDTLPPPDGKSIPVGMGAPISTGPKPGSHDPRMKHGGGGGGTGRGGRGGGRGRGRGGGRGNTRETRRNRPY